MPTLKRPPLNRQVPPMRKPVPVNVPSRQMTPEEVIQKAKSIRDRIASLESGLTESRTRMNVALEGAESLLDASGIDECQHKLAEISARVIDLDSSIASLSADIDSRLSEIESQVVERR